MWINIPRIPSIYTIILVLYITMLLIYIFVKTNILVFISATSICMYVGLFIYLFIL